MRAFNRSEHLLIEEIKTVVGRWSGQSGSATLGAGKKSTRISSCANIPVMKRSFFVLDVSWNSIQARFTEFREEMRVEALRAFFDEVTSVYMEWASRQHEWLKLRDKFDCGAGVSPR